MDELLKLRLNEVSTGQELLANTAAARVTRRDKRARRCGDCVGSTRFKTSRKLQHGAARPGAESVVRSKPAFGQKIGGTPNAPDVVGSRSQEAYSEEAGVATLDERVAHLEGRVEEHARNADGMRDAVVHLGEGMDRRFELVDGRFVAMEDKMDRRFEQVDARFAALEDKMDRRFDSVDTKIGRLTGIVVTALTAMLAIAAGALFQ